MSEVVVILGGMGPQAGITMHEMLLQQNIDALRDQDHMNVIHLSVPSLLSDRTGYLLGQHFNNPGWQAASVLLPVLDTLEKQGYTFHIVVPCATFHSSTILGVFLDQIGAKYAKSFHNLIETTLARHISSAGVKSVGVLSTRGSDISKVWELALVQQSCRQVYLSETEKDEIHRLIYDTGFGIKKHSKFLPQVVEAIQKIARQLQSRGAEVIILGCTELCLPGKLQQDCNVRFINPLQSMASKLIRELC